MAKAKKFPAKLRKTLERIEEKRQAREDQAATPDFDPFRTFAIDWMGRMPVKADIMSVNFGDHGQMRTAFLYGRPALQADMDCVAPPWLPDGS